MSPEPLPIDEYLPAIGDALRVARAAVITAAPGAGKTTRVPPALLDAGPLVLLQPRRMAARAIGRRIAAEQGWIPGDQVGWQVRFERRFTERTRLLVVTEGILTRRLQRDPLLTNFGTIVIDEFHERSIHADVALALARQAWRARQDLRIAIMSATLDVDAVSRYLDGCPIIQVPGRLHTVRVSYAPGRPLSDAVTDALRETGGDVLCFLPGAAEIQHAAETLWPSASDLELLPLHGSLGADAQDRVFSPRQPRRVILATNIAETSITVPRITAVVDTGLQKVARYDPARAIDSLEVARVPQDSADQRAGRAGRLGPGLAMRLWDSRDRLAPHRDAEIGRVDLAATVLDIRAWGGDPATLAWFETPPAASLEAATRLLARLGAVHEGGLTEVGRHLQSFPLHPRLGRILLEARGSWEAAVACAVLSERSFMPERAEATRSDLLSALDHLDRLPPHVRSVARQIQSLARRVLRSRAVEHVTEGALLQAVLAGYPDRVARRRAPGSRRLVLASGHGAVLHPHSGVVEGEFLVALDVQSARAGPGAEALVRLASRVERAWLEPVQTAREHRWDDSAGLVRAFEVERYGALILGERQAPIDRDRATALLADAYRRRGPDPRDAQLLRRLAFAGLETSADDLIRVAASRARRLEGFSLASALPPAIRHTMERLAPERLPLPSGRTTVLEYHQDGSVSASVKLQELFGLAETPRLGPTRVPVRFYLLAPNGRPVQTTTDLRSFWQRTYPEVRKELRRRYPRHPWPEDPWSATPTHRTTPRSPKR
jgi:ATP-dependent helicase HrpB